MDATGRILGLDIGDVRIGVAVSDPLGIVAHPREVIERLSPAQDAEAIRRIAEDIGAVRIVSGIPLDREGKPGAQAEKVLAFLGVLRRVVDIDILTQDERYTTAAAERMLIQANVRRRKRKKVVDKVAAQHILQTYLDRQKNA